VFYCGSWRAGINEEEMADSSLLDDDWEGGEGGGGACLTSLATS